MIELAFLAFIFLFFFQLLTDFIAAIYAFGLLGTGIPPELGFVVLLFSPWLFTLRRSSVSRRLLLVLSVIAMLCRAIEPYLATRERMLIAGIGVSALMMFLPAYIYHTTHRKTPVQSTSVVSALVLAVLFSIALRVLGTGVDISTSQSKAWIGVLLVLLALFPMQASMVKGLFSRKDTIPAQESSLLRTIVLSLGFTSTLVLIYFSFLNPYLLQRWRGANPNLLELILLLTGFGATAFWLYRNTAGLRQLNKPRLLGLQLFFTVVLFAYLWRYQFNFPANPLAYPIFEPAGNLWDSIPIILLPLLAGIPLLCLLPLWESFNQLRPPQKQLGIAFGVSSIYLLLIIFAHVFTTVYDYIPMVGPLFRDKFWLVYTVPSLILALSLIATRSTQYDFTPLKGKKFASTTYIIGILFLIMLTVVGYLAVSPETSTPDGDVLKVMTYNIQQGYSEDGQLNYDGQIELIRSINPDILALQESDSARVANANNDLVHYFASNLNMDVYYGPNTTVGTFGIALLTKYPLEVERTFFMYSEGEQTATIHAQIKRGGKTYNIFVTHLGNGGPIIQQEQILEVVDQLPNVILMGDFNFRPDSPQYQLTRKSLNDAWLLRWPNDRDDQGVHLEKRIDHIFISDELYVTDCRYILSPASDHPAMWAAISP